MRINIRPLIIEINVLSLVVGFLMDLVPDTKNCVLRMRRECRESFPRHRL